MLKRFLPSIKNAGIIAIVILMAYAFIWQRMKLQDLSEDIERKKTEVRQLEKNRDYLKGEILNQTSLEQVKHVAENRLGMQNSEESDLVTYSDSLLTILKNGRKYKPGSSSVKNLAITHDADNPVQGGHPNAD